MTNFTVLQPKSAYTFQVAWESTLKCNLDCSYCGDGHDNSQEHPSLDESLKTVDFIVNYLDLYMSTRPNEYKSANINIQGGESLFHPNIFEILEYAVAKKKLYSNWNLTISMITNAITGPNHWKKIVEFIDYFTISFHAEKLDKQNELFKRNVLHLREINKNNFHVAVLMHPYPEYWDKCVEMYEWCIENDINVIKRQLDHHWTVTRYNYTSEQARYITGMSFNDKLLNFLTGKVNLTLDGRSCCGGLELCASGCSTNRVKNRFKGWHCSVNRSFLYIRQTTGEVFTNKDCRMNLDGKVGVLGYLKDGDLILANLKNKIENNSLPDIICKKRSCWCGICAPKAKTKEEYKDLMNKYLK
jgi:MoaA/NifB/PqqE/SkfB family radical SAM enzyme